MKFYAQMKFDNLLNLLQGVSIYQNNTSVRSGKCAISTGSFLEAKQNDACSANVPAVPFPNKYCLLCLFLVCFGGYFSLANLKYTSL